MAKKLTRRDPKFYTKRVPAEGNPDADLMIVGESPGTNEVQIGRPFVGYSGNELNKILNVEGINRDKCWVTNVVKTHPYGKKAEFFFNKDGSPSKAYIDGIKELQQEIHDVKPNCILALGNYALWALTGKDSITKWRGSILACHLYPETKVVATLHPAYIMRGMWHQRPLTMWDIRRAKLESQKPGPPVYKDREYLIRPGRLEIDEAVERLCSAELIAADSEWYTSDVLSCIGFADSPDWAICIPTHAPGAIDAYRTILGHHNRKVFHNAMFDIVNLRRVGVETRVMSDEGERLIDDTMVAFFVCWPDLGTKKLNDVESIYTDIPYYKEELKIANATGDPDMEYEYNCKDNVGTLESWEVLDGDEMEWMGTKRAYELNMLTFDIMADASITGILIDMPRMVQLADKNQEEADTINEILNDVIGYEINVRSWQQVQRLVYDEMGVRPLRGKGKTTNQEVLMDIAAQTKDQDVKTIMTMIVAIRHRRKRISSFLNPEFVDPDGRMRFSWNMAGTKNGRLSASKTYWESGVPIQQIPDSTREIYIADPGHMFILPDLEQAEARIVAYLTEDYQLLEWMEEGLDIHKKLAALMFNMKYEDVVKPSTLRFIAKTCRHALNYKMGGKQYRLTVNKKYADTGVGIDQTQAEDYVTRYLNIHPNLTTWWSQVKRELERNSAITNCLGRRRRFYQTWGDQLVRDAIACEPQGTVADITHIGLRKIRDTIPYAKILVNMHDGAVIQVPREMVDDAVPLIEECLTVPLTIKGQELVIPVSSKVSRCWLAEDE